MARSMQTIKHPVTLGSRVPLCPVFSTLQYGLAWARQTFEIFASPKHALDPCDNFVTGWIGGLVKVYDTRTNVGFEVALEWCASIGNRREVTSPYKHYGFSLVNVLYIEVLQAVRLL